MKKISLLTAACVFASTGALAQQSQLGLGISHGDTSDDALSMDTAISVPILSGGILIEPYLAYASDDTEIELGAARADVEESLLNIGVGLFATLKSTDNSNFYAGARVWYGTGETEDETSGLDADIESVGLAPTIGFSYLPAKNISIGAEAFFSYSMMETDGDLGAVDFTRETDGFNTGTRLFLRYFCF